jgi:tRNA (guanine26-N2/guanine27-N2)-dimethyltransferase
MDVDTVEVAEGLARLRVPAIPPFRGPGTRTRLPFYNPTMAVNRDLTVLALRAIGGGHLLDALTASGALAARAARESPGWRVTASDWNPVSLELARSNLEANGGGEVAAANLRREVPPGEFTHIDLDPFGTPAPFLPTVLTFPTARTLSVTATDTGALCGTFADACLRRYGIDAGRTPFPKEFGVRALLSFVARQAQRAGRFIRPLLVAAAEHFVKVIVAVEEGDRETPLRRVRLDADGAWRWSDDGFGPLWGGALWDSPFLERCPVPPWMPHRTAALIDRLREEAAGPAFYHTSAAIGRLRRSSVPPLEALLQGLRDAGFTATRTHFAPDGFRTNADLSDVVRAGWASR